MTKIHQLKTWPKFFNAIVSGDKTHDLRKDDRNFYIGDFIILQEWSPLNQEYSGREVVCRVSHILREHSGLLPGFVVLSFKGFV